MHAVDIVLVVGEGEWNRLSVATTLDQIDDVLEATREYVTGPLRTAYPALYNFAEFGLQAVESFTMAMLGGDDYTATIGMADLTSVPLGDRELAAQIAGQFVTALHVRRGPNLEAALHLLELERSRDWTKASYTVEPGPWLTRHMRGEEPFGTQPIQA